MSKPSGHHRLYPYRSDLIFRSILSYQLHMHRERRLLRYYWLCYLFNVEKGLTLVSILYTYVELVATDPPHVPMSFV